MSAPTEPKEVSGSPDKPQASALTRPAVGASTLPTIPQAVTYATQSQLTPPRKPRPVSDVLADANRAIATLTQESPSTSVERSNLFDDWKEALVRAAQTGVSRSGHQRQIVGALLSAIRKKDAVDFNQEQLTVFRSVTNIARANPLQHDATRAIAQLNRHGLLRPMGLSPDGISAAEEQELDSLIALYTKGKQ